MLETLISEADLSARVAEMAEEIKRRYHDEPILLVCVLKGSLYFLSDLSRKLGLDIQIDFIQRTLLCIGREDRCYRYLMGDQHEQLRRRESAFHGFQVVRPRTRKKISDGEPYSAQDFTDLAPRKAVNQYAAVFEFAY